MKKFFRKITSLLLCTVLAAAVVPVSLQAAAPSAEVKVSTTARVCRKESRDVLRMVNEAREAEGIDPIVMSAEMEEAAIQRAFELVTYMTHERPNGDTFGSVFGEYGVDTNVWLGDWIGENIAAGQSSAESVMKSWENSSGHWGQITAFYYHYIGIGCVEYDGVKYWVQLFAEDPSNVTTAPAEGIDGTELTKEVSVDVDNLIAHSKFKTSKIEFTEPEVTVQAGKNETFDLNLNAPDWWGRHRTVGKISFSSLKPEHIEISKDAPLSVSENGISINSDAKPGTYTITVAIGSLSAVKTIKVADKTELCKHPENCITTDEKTPSCTESGYRKEICGECGKILSEKTLEKTDHEKEADWNTEKEAACTEDGKMVKKCIHCGTLLEEAIVPALGHQWSEWKIEKEPAWDSEGMQKRVCSRCTETEEQVLPKLSEVHEHDYTGGETIVKEATCTEDGNKQVSCVDPNCDSKITVTIPKFGHEYSEWKVIREATYTEEGERQRICENCGDVQMEIINKISLPKDDDTVTPDQNQKPDQNQTTDQIPGQAQEVKKEDDIQKNKNQDEDQNTDSEEVVKTGDNNNIYFWGGLAAATASFVSVIVISSKRKINS